MFIVEVFRPCLQINTGKMNLLFNASNLRFGGGITVALHLLKAVIPMRKNDNLFIIAPRHCGYETLAGFDNVHIIFVPDQFHHSWKTKYYYNSFVFRKWVKKFAIDKVVSLGNIAFSANGLPQLVLIHNPHLLYPESPAWKKMNTRQMAFNKLMNAYTTAHLKYATVFAVQTDAMKERLADLFNIADEKIFLLPNALESSRKQQTETRKYVGGNLIFLSKYYPHKNFEILLPLARMIKERGDTITITLTIEAKESADTAKFLHTIQKERLNGIIKNIGHVPLAKITETMRNYDGLLFPTLLESFSGTYLDAMTAGIPIFTSDMDFAKDICSDAAFYFDPMDADNILDTLKKAFADKDLITQKTIKATQILNAMPTWNDVAFSFSEIIDRFD